MKRKTQGRKTAIVKIQLPILTDESVPLALIYEKGHKNMRRCIVNPSLRGVMGDRLKAYFEVYKDTNADGKIMIIRDMGDLDW